MPQEFLNTELKPYNALTREEKHILLDAFLDNCLQYYFRFTDTWHDKYTSEIDNNYIYRTKPKEYKKLDIPWQHINEKWKWAVMDSDGGIYLFEIKPRWNRTHWVEFSEDGGIECVEGILKLDTTGVIAEHSLTQRPE